MKYGFILTGDPEEVVELAQEAEAAGWDGVFLPDDWTTAWIKLTAIAMRAQRILLGTMLTPLPEQFPWYVAAQTATLDQLSDGRVIRSEEHTSELQSRQYLVCRLLLE